MLVYSARKSTDPDGQALTYLWKEAAGNPAPISGIEGRTDETFTLSDIPDVPGDYLISLSVQDPDGNVDSTKASFYTSGEALDVRVAGYEDNPAWVKQGRVYQIFLKAFTREGTFRAAAANLDYVKAMGFNIIWLLPITTVNGDMDNQTNIGYNIVDFRNADPAYGSNEDYQFFLDEAHKRGIRVVQDITPNHTGNEHPFAKEARAYGDLSGFWNYYQTELIPHNDNGLGQCKSKDGIYHYCAFSDILLNYNWDDLDSRLYMIDVYDHWVRNFDIDGYRFDIYWGIRRKFGQEKTGVAIRAALKRIKPDILLLGEDDGTGADSEQVYADRGGGLDTANDWRLYWDAINNFNFTSGAVNTLHARLDNDGFFPGPNAYYYRWLENHDEDRISYVYDSFEKTMPMATAIFMAPGLPGIYNGQEVGWGKGMGAPGEPDLNDRRRGVIDWNFGGGELLIPHYQKLAQIRAQFPAFSQHKQDSNFDGQINDSDESDFDRIVTGNGFVYAFLRPFTDANGIAVTNFSAAVRNAELDLTALNMKFTDAFSAGNTYYSNDLYADTTRQYLGSDLSSFKITLAPYGSAIYTISPDQQRVVLPELPPVSVRSSSRNQPDSFLLYQNYPNPFNPSTHIRYSIEKVGRVVLTIYDLLGRKIRTLVDELQQPGEYISQWDGSNSAGSQVASGVYIVHLLVPDHESAIKIVKLK
jgi:glycosidase